MTTYRDPLTALCPKCARSCREITDPFGYYFAEPLFACDNCELGDGVDSERGIAVALGPLTFTFEESQEARETGNAQDIRRVTPLSQPIGACP